jgi:hypothetical protein
MRIFLIFSFFLTVWNLNAQNYKYEHEKTVSFTDVPDLAIETVEYLCGQHKKGKWLRENNIDRISFEFKTKIDKQKISIEFDSVGNFEDLEMNYSFKKLSPDLQSKISKYLMDHYKTYSIKTLQLQWTSYERPFTNTSFADYTNIEIVIKALKGKQFGSFELLFDKAGKFISESEIVDKINSDHLDY